MRRTAHKIAAAYSTQPRVPHPSFAPFAKEGGDFDSVRLKAVSRVPHVSRILRDVGILVGISPAYKSRKRLRFSATGRMQLSARPKTR